MAVGQGNKGYSDITSGALSWLQQIKTNFAVDDYGNPELQKFVVANGSTAAGFPIGSFVSQDLSGFAVLADGTSTSASLKWNCVGGVVGTPLANDPSFGNGTSTTIRVRMLGLFGLTASSYLAAPSYAGPRPVYLDVTATTGIGKVQFTKPGSNAKVVGLLLSATTICLMPFPYELLSQAL